MTSTASLFRRYVRIEDLMMRATMPRVAAADPKLTRASVGSRIEKLSFTMKEAAHA